MTYECRGDGEEVFRLALPHRYAVYLSFMHAAARQLADHGSWPSDASPDLLEYALFSTSWM